MKTLSRYSRGIKRTLSVLSVTTVILCFQNCSGNFQSMNISSLSTAPVNSQGKALYTQHCAACHGPIESSAKLNRTAAQIALAMNSQVEMSSLFLTSSEIELVAAALSSTSGPPPVQNGSNRLEFACTTGQLQNTPMLKLTNREYRNSLFALLDLFSTNLKTDTSLLTLLNALPTDIATQDRDTLKEQSLLNTSAITSGLFNASYRAAELAADSTTGLSNFPNTNSCLSAAALTQACHQLYVGELGSRAFRRLLPTAERNAIAARYWDTTLSKREQLLVTFTALTSMPDFLYKIYDRGTPVTTGSAVLNLTAHELAAKTALFLTGAPPDATLKALADNGTLLQDTVLEQQIDRLLALPAARETVRRLFRESYGYDVFGRLDYDSSFIGGVSTTGLNDVMTAELDNFFSEIVIARSGTFRDIMTSRYSSFTDSRLATIYGSGSGTLPDERSGFLNRAAILTKRSGYTASPIKRGLAVLEHSLCENMGLPPPSAPTSLPVITGEYLTTRDRTVRTTEVAGTACTQCHTRMNNLGYAFENFDSFGRLRTNEAIYENSNVVATLPVNTSITTSELESSPTSLNSSRALVERLGNNDRAMMCFVKHLKRFESRIAIDANANCQMNQSLRTLYGTNNTQGSITSAIKSLVMSPEFRRWKN